MYDDKFQEKIISSPYIDTLKVMSSQITSMLVSLGKPQTTRENLFRYLLDPVIPIIAEHTSQELVSRNKAPTNEEEIWEFVVVATIHLCSTFDLSRDLGFKLMEETANQRKFQLMAKDRYIEILHSLRGFGVALRHAQDK